MSFWDEHAAREAALAPPAPPSAQNAPTECECGHVGPDVLLGLCSRCGMNEICDDPDCPA